MDSLLVFPDNDEQLNALKIVIKAMKINFHQKANDYPPHVIENIGKSIQEAKDGKVHPYHSLKEMLDR